MTSAALFAIFSKIEGREPGPKRAERFGRAGGTGWVLKLIEGPPLVVADRCSTRG